MSSTRNISLIGWHNFFSEFRPYAAVNAIYFAEVTGSYTQAMSVFALTLLCSLILEVPTGVLSDKIGRRATLIWGSITFALSIFCYAYAQNIFLLLIGGAIGGLSDALVSGNNTALIYESIPITERKERFNSVLSKLNAVFQISLGLAALLGGFLLYYDLSLRNLVWIGFSSQIFCIALSFFIIEPTVHTQRATGTTYFHDVTDAIRLIYINKKLRLAVLANALQFGLGEASHRFSPAFFGNVWPVWAVNMLSSIRNLLGVIGYWISALVIRKWGDAKTLMISSSLMSAFSIIAALLNNVWSPPIVFLNNLLYGINDVAKEQLLQHEFSDAQRATMGSLAQFLGSCIGVISTILLGVLADLFDPSLAFLVAMLCRLPAIVLYWNIKNINNSIQK